MCPSVLSAAACLSMLWMFNLHRTWLWYGDAGLHSFWKPLKTTWSWKYIDDLAFSADGLWKYWKLKKLDKLKFWRDRAYSAKNGSNWLNRRFCKVLEMIFQCVDSNMHQGLNALMHFVIGYSYQITQCKWCKLKMMQNAFCKRIDFSCSTHQRPRKNK